MATGRQEDHERLRRNRLQALQKSVWNDLATHWDRWHDTFETGGVAVTSRLINLADVRTGQRVLDIGSGTGQPALEVAQRVGPTGEVTGTDQSPEILSVATRKAAEAGLEQLVFQECDAEQLPFPPNSFDVVTSRFSLMFLPDLDGALRSLRRVLRAGGVIVASVWGPPHRVPLLSVGFGLATALLELDSPPPGRPGPFALADPAALVDRIKAAGFADVSHEELIVEFSLASPDEFVRFSLDLLPGWLRAKLVDRFGTVADPALEEAIKTVAKLFERADGTLSVPCTAHLVSATKPA